MNEYLETEREIDLKDLLYRCLKNWRKIVVGAIVIGLLAALFQAFSGVRVLLDDEALTEAQGKYEIALNDHKATGELLRTSIVNLRDQSEKQQEYNEKSELMKIDPMNKWVGNFQLYVNSKYQIDPSLTYQNIDLTNRLVSAYLSYLRSGELYKEIIEELGTVDEIRFLTEIYSASADPGTATITVNCVGKSEEDIRALLGFVQQKIAERYDTIKNTIGDHSVDVLTESVYSTIDLDLDEKQKANLQAISEYANAIGEKNTELSEWEEKPEPKKEFGTWYTVKKAIKFLILGGIIGVVVLFCWFAAKYVMSGTIKTKDDWRAFGLPVLGMIERDTKKKHFKWLDDLIDRIFGRTQAMTMEQQCVLAAHNLSAMLREQEIGDARFVGHLDRSFAEGLAQKMDAATETAFSYAGDALAEPETAKKLGQADKVLLLAENGTTQLKDIAQTLTLLKAWGKTVLGAVVVD